MSAPAAATDPAERGTLHLADRVVEKVAARAAGELAATTELAARLADRLPGRHPAPARARALVSGRLVQLQVSVALAYPAPIAAATREIRTHVRETVGRLCGVEVRDVDIEVTRLHRPRRGRRVL